MATYYQHEKFINLCRAAKELRAALGDDIYRSELPRILTPFNRAGRSIGLSHVRGKDMEAATAALRQRTALEIGSTDALVERAMVESWCKKNGYALVPVEEWRKCSDLQLSKLLDEMFASSLDKPKSLG